MKMSGNTILITGGSSGIGFQMAKELIGRGNKVIITGRNQAKLDQAKQQLPQINVFKSDTNNVSESLALHAHVIQKFPELNWLINNAGIMKKVNLNQEIGLDALIEEIEINLMGPIRMVQLFLPHLKKMSEAAIVNVSSGLAFVPLPMSPIYCSSKAGLHSFTQSLRVQLQNTKVRVFELAPPATETDLLTAFEDIDMKGIKVMGCSDLVRAALRGFERDQFEICPGSSGQLRFMSRFAPKFILKQLSKSSIEMLNK